MNLSQKVLLLNPPGTDIYIRDYYCSKTSRTDYTFPPIDLLYAGGTFRKSGWEVAAIDAIGERLSPEQTLHKAGLLNPRAVFVLVGAVSAKEDAAFLADLRKTLPDCCFIGSGDILLEHGRKWLQRGLLDGVALDFASPSIVLFAQGNRGNLDDFIYMDGNQIHVGNTCPDREVSTGLPPHELFNNIPYRFPFARKRPFASLLTDYGCPFRCSFCVMSGLRYRYRPLDEVAAELTALRNMGVQELIIWDQTFAVDRKRGMAFLDMLPEGQQCFGWTCFLRPDRIDDELARKMVLKGCHTVIMGVETARESTLKAIKKDFVPNQVRAAFNVCREAGLDTVATVIIGLPGEDTNDVLATMDFICEVDPDYLSLHTAVPRSATGLRNDMLKQGLIDASFASMDQSGSSMTVGSDTLDATTILALRRKFNRHFYLRPKYLLRSLFMRLRQPRLFIEQCRQGLLLIVRNI